MIGSGSFGTVFKCINRLGEEQSRELYCRMEILEGVEYFSKFSANSQNMSTVILVYVHNYVTECVNCN